MDAGLGHAHGNPPRRFRIGGLLGAALAVFWTVGTASAGDVMWYLGHSGSDEGHTQIVNLLQTTEGAVVDVVNTNPLPALDGYTLVFIVMPGFNNPSDFFSADEKTRLGTWLQDGTHRVVMVGDWDQFYHGQDVMNDLLAAIGNPIVFSPGAYDGGCGHCSGPLGATDPLTAGLDHICYALTPTWDPAHGVPLAYPENSSAPGPWIVSNGTNIPCIVGVGDQNALSDACGYMGSTGDTDSQTFARRLYTINCEGVNVQFGLTPVDATSDVGTSHTLTARVQENGSPVAGALVTFTVLSGPHAGTTGTDTTDSGGFATFSYTGTAPGTDVIEATYVRSGQTQHSNQANKTWTEPAETTTTTSTSTTSSTSSTSTTTTTLPVGCIAAVTFESILCRIDQLIADVTASGLSERVRNDLLVHLTNARASVVAAEQRADAGRNRGAHGKLKSAARKLRSFGFRVRSLAGSRAIPGPTADDYRSRSKGIEADCLTLSKSFPF